MEHNLKRLDRKVVYPGKVLNFCKDTMQLPTGKIEEWDFLQRVGFPAAQEGRRSLRRPGPSGRAYSYDSSIQTGC